MPEFKVPIVFKVEADTQEKAEIFVDSLMCDGFLAVQDTNPKIYEAIKWWDFAEIRSRKGTP